MILRMILMAAFLLFCPFCLNAAKGVLDNYEKQLDKLRDACEKIEELYEERDELKERERERRRAEREARRSSNDDDDDDDEDDNEDREALRRRRKQVSDQRRKIQDQVNQTKAELHQEFLQHEHLADDLQSFLNRNGIGKNFVFSEYGKQISKTFKDYGIGFEKEKNMLVSSKAQDPAYMFAVLSFDLACLQAAGVEDDSIPGNYIGFRTFFRFYEQLEFYRLESGGFGSCKSMQSRKLEFKRRFPQLLEAGNALHRLLLKNDPKIAKTVNLPQFLEKIQLHQKKTLFWELTDFDAKISKMLDSPSLEQRNNIQLKRDLTKMAEPFDLVAKALRCGEISGNTTDGFSVKKNRNRSRSRRAKEKKSIELPPEVLCYADDSELVKQGKAAAAAGNETAAEENAATGETVPEKRTMPSSADLRKFRREVEKFRQQYAGTANLLALGLAEENYPALKQTMTPEMWDAFEANTKRILEKGKSRPQAAAEAYLIVLTAEKQNKDKISVEQVDAIRKFMKEAKQ